MSVHAACGRWMACDDSAAAQKLHLVDEGVLLLLVLPAAVQHLDRDLAHAIHVGPQHSAEGACERAGEPQQPGCSVLAPVSSTSTAQARSQAGRWNQHFGCASKIST